MHYDRQYYCYGNPFGNSTTLPIKIDTNKHIAYGDFHWVRLPYLFMV